MRDGSTRRLACAPSVLMKRKNQEQSDYHPVLRNGRPGFIATHHVAGLLAGYRVGKERHSVGQSATRAVTIACVATAVAVDRRQADPAGETGAAHWIAQIAATDRDNGASQACHCPGIKHPR